MHTIKLIPLTVHALIYPRLKRRLHRQNKLSHWKYSSIQILITPSLARSVNRSSRICWLMVKTNSIKCFIFSYESLSFGFVLILLGLQQAEVCVVAFVIQGMNARMMVATFWAFGISSCFWPFRLEILKLFKEICTSYSKVSKIECVPT